MPSHRRPPAHPGTQNPAINREILQHHGSNSVEPVLLARREGLTGSDASERVRLARERSATVRRPWGVPHHRDYVDERLGVVQLVSALEVVDRETVAASPQLLSQSRKSGRTPFSRSIQQHANGLDLRLVLTDESGERLQVVVRLVLVPGDLAEDDS